MSPRRYHLLVSLAIPGALLTIYFMSAAWDRLCGNYPIRFYGRVVDANGVGVPGVDVTVQVLYSNAPVVPVMFGRAEHIRKRIIRSDSAGNFELTTGSGYSLSIVGIHKSGRELDWAGPGPHPQTTFTHNTQIEEALIPDAPAKRLIYPLK